MTTHLVPPIWHEYSAALDEMTRFHIRRVYEKHGNNLTKTAEALKTAWNRVRKYL